MGIYKMLLQLLRSEAHNWKAPLQSRLSPWHRVSEDRWSQAGKRQGGNAELPFGGKLMWAMRGTCWLYPVPITQFTLTRIFCWILSVAQHLTASAQTAGVRLVLILRGLPFRGDLRTEACLRIVKSAVRFRERVAIVWVQVHSQNTAAKRLN